MPDTLNIYGFLNAVKARIETITDPQIDDVQLGASESVEGQVTARISLGGVRTFDRVNNIRTAEIHAFVILRVQVINSNEVDAEMTLASLINALVVLHLQDRTWNGAVTSSELDMQLADDPRYQAIAGPEYRAYPVLVVGKQDKGFLVPIPP